MMKITAWILLAFCGVLFFGCSGDKKVEIVEQPPMKYDGRVICPRCERYLNKDIFDRQRQIVECPECKGKAPVAAYCPDMKRR